MTRGVALLLALAGCGWDTSDLNDERRDDWGRRVDYCFEMANNREGGYKQEVLDRCLHGHAQPGDAGVD